MHIVGQILSQQHHRLVEKYKRNGAVAVQASKQTLLGERCKAGGKPRQQRRDACKRVWCAWVPATCASPWNRAPASGNTARDKSLKFYNALRSQRSYWHWYLPLYRKIKDIRSCVMAYYIEHALGGGNLAQVYISIQYRLFCFEWPC